MDEKEAEQINRVDELRSQQIELEMQSAELRRPENCWKKIYGTITNKKANDIFCHQCVVACSL
jgi:hypothetical protein